MRTPFNTSILSLVLIAFAVGCSERDQATGSRDPQNVCGVALVRHEVSTAVDLRIKRFQDANRHELSGPHLERLGWSYVAKFRETDDPGYLSLARRTAECMGALGTRSATDSGALLLSHALHQQHQFDEAEKVARELVRRRGLWFDHAVLGDVLLDRGDLAGAVEQYQVAIDGKPGPQTFSRAAQVRWQAGDRAGAIDMMKRAIRSGDVRDRDASAWSYVTLARWVWQVQGDQPAEKLLDSALALKPGHAGALALRGRMAVAAGDVPRAISNLERATLSGGHPEWLWWLLEAHESADRRGTELHTRFRRSAEVEDPRTLALYLSSRRIDPEIAVALARRELTIRQDALTKDALGWALWANGDIEEAITFSRDALAANSLNPRILYHAAVIAAAASFRDEAQARFQAALQQSHLLLPSERRHLQQEFAAFAADPSAVSVTAGGHVDKPRRKF